MGHEVTKENINPLIITISPLNKMDMWVTIGVDVTGTDPMGLIRIIVSQTGITAATPLIRPGVLEERKVIVKELGQVTIEDTFAIETGYGDRNEWLEWVKYTARTTQAQGCFCAAAQPNLATMPAMGKSQTCLVKLFSQENVTGCIYLSIYLSIYLLTLSIY